MIYIITLSTFIFMSCTMQAMYVDSQDKGLTPRVPLQTPSANSPQIMTPPPAPQNSPISPSRNKKETNLSSSGELSESDDEQPFKQKVHIDAVTNALATLHNFEEIDDSIDDEIYRHDDQSTQNSHTKKDFLKQKNSPCSQPTIQPIEKKNITYFYQAHPYVTVAAYLTLMMGYIAAAYYYHHLPDRYMQLIEQFLSKIKFK